MCAAAEIYDTNDDEIFASTHGVSSQQRQYMDLDM